VAKVAGVADSLAGDLHLLSPPKLSLHWPSASDFKMSCQHEAHDYDHDHSQDGGDGDHGHSHDVPLSAGPQDSLYPVIDVTHVVAMNAEGGAEAGQKVVKWVHSTCGCPTVSRWMVGLDSGVVRRAYEVRSWEDREDESRVGPLFRWADEELTEAVLSVGRRRHDHHH
jgi:hypothetical protein